MQINLLPWRQQKRARNKRQFCLIFSLIVIIIISVSLVWHLRLVSRHHRLSNHLRALAQEMTEVTHRLEPLQVDVMRQNLYRSQWRITQMLMAALPDLLPQSIRITHLELAQHQLKITAQTVSEQGLQKAMQQLKAYKLIHKVRIDSAEQKERIYFFRILIELKDGADVG